MDLAQDPKLQRQIELELLHNKNQTVPRIRHEFTSFQGFDFQAHMEQHGIDPAFGFDVLTQMALRKRCPLPTLVGVLRHHFDDSQATADMLLECAKADLVDWNANLQLFIVRFGIGPDVQAELDRYQFPLPMVVQPELISHNRETGYLTSGGSVILKKNHHEGDVCLDHLNRLNAIRFALDFETATMIQNRWKSLDKPKEGETRDDFERRKKAFAKYDATAREVMDKVTEHGNEIFLTHRYDKRGRTYCQGYHVNYQGNPWNKAVVQLADKEVVDE